MDTVLKVPLIIYLFIYNVYDPFNVKQLLDEAVKKAKINEYQD